MQTTRSQTLMMQNDMLNRVLGWRDCGWLATWVQMLLNSSSVYPRQFNNADLTASWNGWINEQGDRIRASC